VPGAALTRDTVCPSRLPLTIKPLSLAEALPFKDKHPQARIAMHDMNLIAFFILDYFLMVCFY
jgi:hypothetical protein